MTTPPVAIEDDPEHQRYEVRLDGALAGFVPLCAFIAGYLERHDEYVDLVAEPYRGRVT